ncbi:MAG: OmpA family protein [Methylococcales bacterium]|nr:OmpA family protein [Methylococcales bacterium]
MKKTLFQATIIAAVALSGCATQSANSFQPFQAQDLNSAVQSGELRQKSKTLFVINDSSSSMGDIYSGSGFSSSTKLSVEKELLNRMNLTLPNISLSSGLRSFGFGSCLGFGFTKLNQAVQSHTSASFNNAINSLTCSSGGTPVDSAFTAANADLATAPGNIAVILLSDGHNYGVSPVPAIKSLKKTYGDKLCVYTVWVGNEEQKSGQAVLQNLSAVSGCGFSTTAAAISSDTGMSNFVSKVLFTHHTPISATPVPDLAAIPALTSVDGDTDGDGVIDSQDKCPNTPKGANVDKDGCWAFHGVLFDFDKATIKAGSEGVFANAIKVLSMNPQLTVEIQGHTDSKGSEKYNQQLSERRAKSVKQYLVTHGIEASRLTTKGFGESSPMTSNDTKEGRAHNRRVFYKRTDK